MAILEAFARPRREYYQYHITIMAILEAFARPRREYYQYHIGNGQLLRAVYNQGEITVSAMGNSGV